MNILIVIAAFLIAVYTFNFARIIFSEKNKLGGSAVIVLGLAVLAAPFVILTIIK
ncbi:hypothetical protein [Bacillus marinisedimentorum]|uniref:hypothetical protein n=1 Tax=Bacillus marinisedimentorum TaxID=1821260 RepID=UPI0012FF949B|nr:hypothetical protein [Bacillus marinisedimentorum]